MTTFHFRNQPNLAVYLILCTIKLLIFFAFNWPVKFRHHGYRGRGSIILWQQCVSLITKTLEEGGRINSCPKFQDVLYSILNLKLKCDCYNRNNIIWRTLYSKYFWILERKINSNFCVKNKHFLDHSNSPIRGRSNQNKVCPFSQWRKSVSLLTGNLASLFLKFQSKSVTTYLSGPIILGYYYNNIVLTVKIYSTRIKIAI